MVNRHHLDAVNKKSLTLLTGDGLYLSATLFEPTAEANGDVLVIASALGVPRYFYYKFAGFLASKGCSVISFDYRGIYESRGVARSGSEMIMEEWGKFDIEAALKFALDTLNSERVFYLGHSCGGQLLGLAPSCTEIDRMVFVASQLGYWRLWPRPLSYGVLMTWQIISLMVPFFDYLPTKKMGISSLNLPSGVAGQWSKWGKTQDYLFNEEHNLETYRYSQLAKPLLSYHFSDDKLFAPAASVDALLAKYERATVTRREIKPAHINAKSIGHFGFFKERFKDTLWQETLKWFNNKDTG